MPSSNGQQVSNAGRLQTTIVVSPYTPLATDVYIRGELHSGGGIKYTTGQANAGNDVFLNGLRHDVGGVQRIGIEAASQFWPEGFASSINGRGQQSPAGSPDAFIRGIGVLDAGTMMIDVV